THRELNGGAGRFLIPGGLQELKQSRQRLATGRAGTWRRGARRSGRYCRGGRLLGLDLVVERSTHDTSSSPARRPAVTSSQLTTRAISAMSREPRGIRAWRIGRRVRSYWLSQVGGCSCSSFATSLSAGSDSPLPS